MKHTYNTGKVLIGLAYEPPPVNRMTSDEYRLQRALLRCGQPITPGWTTDTLLWCVAAVLFSAAIYLFTR